METSDYVEPQLHHQPEVSAEHHLSKQILQLLFRLNDLMHILVAALLFLAAVAMLGYTVWSLHNISSPSIIQVIDHAVFVIIILELFWTMLCYLRRRAFPINSFIFIGIISSIRRILLIETQASMTQGIPTPAVLGAETTQMAIYSGVILVLVLSYLVLSKLPAPKD